MKLKRFVSVILCLALVLTLPVSVSAAPASTGYVATMSDVTVSGTVGTATSTDVTLSLTGGETFASLTAGAIAASWFTNLPGGLTASIGAAVSDGATTAAISISGTPAEASGAQMGITIPADALKSGAALPVNTNSNAKFFIAPAPPAVLTDADLVVAANSISVKAGKSVEVNEYAVTSNSAESAPEAGWVSGTGITGAAIAFTAGIDAESQYKVWVRVKAIDGGAPASDAAVTEVYTLPETPVAADFSVTQPTTASGDTSKGRIVPVDPTAGKYEYRIKSGEVWPEEWNSLGTTGAAIEAPATIEVRVAGIDGSPASAAYTITINQYVPSSGGGSSASNKVPVIVDGQTYNIGTSKTAGRVTTVTVDQSALQKQLDASSETIVIPVATGSNANTGIARIVVANVDKMAQKEMTLSVQVDNVNYDMPAVALDTKMLLQQIGAVDPSAVPLNVSISELSEDDVTLENGELVLPPVEFTVIASFSGRSTEVEVFEKYVQRVIEIPEGTDASRITTAVVVEKEKQRHVPTEVFQKSGKWYAKINSLTNSTYALIHNEQSFADTEGKWFADVVNEMASRGIINGRAAGIFDGDANITRAEFAVILVRALGLPETGDASRFADIAPDAWCSGAVGTAYAYDIVNGRTDNAFDPNANITRQEAMAMVRRAAAVTELSGTAGTLAGFSDADSVSSWARADAQWNVGSGLIQGNSAGMIRGQDNITRGETATIILRLLQKSELVDVRTQA